MATPALPSPAPNWWKKLAIRAFSFGVGAATFSALLAAGFLLYEHHEHTKAWTSPMKASLTEVTREGQGDALNINFRYAIENGTSSDYRIPIGATILLRLPNGLGYEAEGESGVKLGNLAYIPAHQKVNILVSWSIPYTGSTFIPGKNGNVDDESFFQRKLAENDGFTVFDQINRYQIDLPNTWKDWPAVKKIVDAKNQKESQPTAVNADVRKWVDAEVDGYCSSTDDILPLLPTDEPSVKLVVLQCVLRNRTGIAVHIPPPDKVESVIRLPNGTTVRGEEIYLGSSKKVIPAPSGLTEAGLFLPHKCDVKQHDSACALEGLMQGKELLLTDTTNGIRFHIRID